MCKIKKDTYMKKSILKIATICLMGTSLFASNNTIIPTEQKSPQQVLKDSFNFMGALDKYKVTAKSNHLLYDGHGTLRAQYKNEYKILVDRPYKAYIEVEGDTKYREYFFNAGNYTLYNEERIKYWGDMKTPAKVDDALKFMMDKYGVKEPISVLVFSNMADKIKPNSVSYFGIKMKNGKQCHEIGFKSKDHKKNIYVWISALGNPLIEAFTISRKTAVNEYRINVDVKWDLKPWISDSDFIFKKRGNGKKIPIQIKKGRQF